MIEKKQIDLIYRLRHRTLPRPYHVSKHETFTYLGARSSFDTLIKYHHHHHHHFFRSTHSSCPVVLVAVIVVSRILFGDSYRSRGDAHAGLEMVVLHLLASSAYFYLL